MATPRCSAHRSNGEPCKAYAVRGATVCVTHGGAAPRVREAAARRVAEEKAAAKMRLFAAPVDIDPAQALLELVQWTAGEVRYWRGVVEQIAQDDGRDLAWGKIKAETGIGPEGPVDTTTYAAEPPVEYRMLTDAQDRLAKYAAAALRAGVQERQIKLAEDQGVLVAQVIRRILDRLDLAEWQAELVPTVVPEELRALASVV